MLVKSLFSAIVAVGFVGGMRVPTEVYITTPSSLDKSGIEYDLRAPAQTASISQYHQVPTQDQFLYAALLHNVHFLPFDVADVQDDGNTYKVYRPDPEEDPQFVDMQPPTIGDEPNYYASEKPRKSKKYSKAVEEGKQKKHFTKDDKKSHESVRSDREVDVKGSQSENVERQPEQDEQSDDYEYSDSVEQSELASRLDFQLHGHKGADTYKFGYDTGKGQYQIEEKDEQGNVYGKYGFLDDKGVFRETKYSVKKNQGFRVL